MHVAKLFLLLALMWPLHADLAATSPGHGGTGDRFEAVITPNVLYLSDLVSNKPIDQAVIEMEAGTWTGKAQATAQPGIYQVAWSPPGQEAAEVTLTITGPAGSDLILIQIPATPATVPVETTAQPSYGPVAGLLLLVVAGGWMVARRKRSSLAVGLLLLGGLALEDAHAHGDEDHGASGQEAPSQAVQTLTGRVVTLAKASQFLLEVQTTLAASRPLAETVRLVGRVIPAPAAHARIHPLVVSRIGFDPDFPPPTSGQWVKRGQTLAVLDPVMSVMEKAGQRLALFKGERPEATVGRELVLAPIDGQLTDVHIIPGEVVNENTVLAEIIDPNQLWVEAVLYDLGLADRVAGGTAATRQIPGRTFALRLTGVSPKVNEENQGLHMQFLVENSQGLLKAGMPLDVYASTHATFQSVVVPRQALLEQAGQTLVWVKTAPEQFEGRFVRVGQRTAAWAAIQEGIRAGDKVVIQGHNQLNAIR